MRGAASNHCCSSFEIPVLFWNFSTPILARMELKCVCLNVSICVQQDTFGRSVDLEALRQPGLDDPFNGCSLREVELDLGGVSIKQSCLVTRVLHGDLYVFKCHGCELVTHVSHQHKPGRLFINSELVHEKGNIDGLRHAPNYSAVFGIVLPPDHSSGFPDVARLRRNLGSSVTKAQQVMETYIMAEEASTQAKIQAFVDEQNLALAHVRQKALQDLHNLYHTMSNVPVAGERQTDEEAAKSVRHVSAERPENVSVFPTEHSLRHQIDLTATEAGVFHMDDLDVDDGLRERSAFVSDDDDEEECDTSTDNSFQGPGIVVAPPRQEQSSSGGAWMLGRSAPVTIAPAGDPFFRRDAESSDTEDTTPSFADIGKSIKALAQSVQDQSMQLFGELPRPRTATSFRDTVS